MKVTREEEKITTEFGSDIFNKNVKKCFDDFLKVLEQTQDKMYALMSEGIEKAPRNKFDGIKIIKDESNPELEKLPELDLGLEKVSCND